MPVNITQDEMDIFLKNGISENNIKETVNNYRADGLADDEIRARFDKKLNSFKMSSTYRAPKTTEYVEPKDFKKNVDTRYNIPQVEMPVKGDYLVNSDGNEYPLETKSQNNFLTGAVDVAKSLPATGKEFGVGAYRSFPQFGKGVNDLVALTGDVTGIKGLSDFGRSNAQYWQNTLDNMPQRGEQYQGAKGLTNPKTFLPTVAGTVGEQATNLLMSGGGAGAGAKTAATIGLGKLGTGVLSTAGTAIPNLAQEGEYLDKIDKFKEIFGRNPNGEELQKIQRVAIGEKAINTALETISDKLLFGKLFPQGAITKNAKGFLKSAGQQALTEGVTETAQEGTSIGAEKLLGINDSNNLQRLIDSGVLGAVSGGVLGGGSSIVAQPYETQIQPSNLTKDAIAKTQAKLIVDGKVLYDSAHELANNIANKVIDNPTGFDQLRAISQQGVLNKVPQEIAQPQNVSNWDISALPRYTQEEANLNNQKLIEQLAPNIAKKQQLNYEAENVPIELNEIDNQIEQMNAEKIANDKLVSEIAPNIAKKIENHTEQPLDMVKNAAEMDKEEKEALQRRNEACYEILARATGKNIKYIKMAFNTKSNANKGALKRSEAIQQMIAESDDKILAEGFNPSWGEFFSPNANDSELAQQAINYLTNKTNPNIEQKQNEEYNEYLKQMHSEIDKYYNDIWNTNTIDERLDKYNEYSKELEKYGKELPEGTFDKLASLLNDEDLSYNEEKGLNDEQIKTDNGRLSKQTSGNDGTTENGLSSERISPTKESNTTGSRGAEQQAIEGLEDISRKNVQKQQDEYDLKVTKEKYSTTQNGNQQAMFNTEQFKNGQQMLIDTSNLGNFDSDVSSQNLSSGINRVAEKIKDYVSIKKGIKNGITVKDFFKNSELSDVFADKIQGIEDYNIIEMPARFKRRTLNGKHIGSLKTVMLNMDAIGNNKQKFVETLMHELEHARQENKYQELNRKRTKTENDRAFIRAYKECERVNREKDEFYKKHKEILAVALNNRINKTNAEYNDYFNACTKYEKLVILNYQDLVENYLNAEHEVQAREAGKDAVRRLQNEADSKGHRQYEPRRNRTQIGDVGGLREERTFRTRPQSSDYEGRNQRDLDEGLDLRPTTTKERGAIKTLNKYNEDMANAVTDREYEVRGLKKVSKELSSMSEKEIEDILSSEKISDVKTVALAQSIKDEIEKGNVPISKLNKWAVEGTEIGQAMQDRKAIAPESVEEAVIRMNTYNTEKAPKTARKLLNDSENLVKQIKQDINSNPYKDETSVLSDLGKVVQANKEHKKKVVERLITERTFGLNRKKRADLIDNILKLEENDGLTADNVCKLICKMYKIQEVNKTDVEELKKLADDIKNAKTQRDEDVAKAKMQRYVIDNSIGSNIYNKIDTIRYINMLGGTAQRVLDFVSTGIYQIVRLADGTTSLVLDKTLSKQLGVENVTNGFYASEWAKGFAQGAKEGFYDTVQGIETGRAGETARYDLNKPLAFRYRPLKLKKGFLPKVRQGVENTFSAVEKFVNGMVKIPDRAYFSGRYNASLLEQMSARGIDTKQFKKLKGNTLAEALTEKATKEEIEQALLEARENVFQRDCAASKMARNIRLAFNVVHIGGFKMGDWAFPFIHTTSVISEDIIDRIGLGYIRGCSEIYRIKRQGGTKAELRNAYNSIAKSIVGTIIICVGAMSGAEDEEKTPAEKEMFGGHQKAINIGNVSYNAKDIPFLTVPIRLGKLLMTNDEHKIKKAILQTWDVIADTNPILSKYKESAQNNYKNKDEADILDQFIADTIGTTAGQLVQNSQLRNIRTITDPYERETYDPNSAINTQINRFKNSNPFTSKSLPYKYNAVGEKVNKTGIENTAERTLSALVTSHRRLNKKNETFDKFNRLGKAFKDSEYKGKNSLYMTKIKRGINVNGETYKMTPEEFSAFQRDYGRINYNIRSKMLNNSDFMSQDAGEFVKNVNELRQSIEEAVKIMQLGHKPALKKNGEYKLYKYTELILRNYDTLTQ